MSEYMRGYLDAANDVTEVINKKLRPTLNSKQQQWISRLKVNYSWYGKSAQHALYATLQEPDLPDLLKEEFAQILRVFGRWLEKPEEKR